MNRKKRIIAGFLSVLMISMFCACSSGGDQSDLSGAVSGNMESSVIAHLLLPAAKYQIQSRKSRLRLRPFKHRPIRIKSCR